MPLLPRKMGGVWRDLPPPTSGIRPQCGGCNLNFKFKSPRLRSSYSKQICRVEVITSCW
jgi:hypothetical protein